MAPKVDTVPSNDTLPAQADVVIVGGGIVGVMAALHLAEQGISVTLLEKGIIAGEQSGRNWGWCREQLRSLPEIPLAMRSLQLWRGLSERIAEPSGFRQTGMMVVTKSLEELQNWRDWLETTKDFGMPGGILSAAEVREKLPLTTEEWIGAIYSPTDGWAEPAISAPAIARAAQRRGAIIMQNCAVRGWETTAGEVSQVITERGAIKTSRVLVAAGCWSLLLLRNQGIKSFPQSGVYATAFRTEPGPEVFPGGVGSPYFSYRHRDDGGYTIGLRGRGRVEITPTGILQARHFLPLFFARRSDLKLRIGRSFFDGPFALHRWRMDQISPFERHRRYDPPPNPEIPPAGMKAFRAAYAAMQQTGIAETWGGLIDATPDSVPVISQVDGHRGCFLASGFSGHGFAIGPAAGEMAAQMIMGTPTTVDATPFRLARFAEGGAHGVHRWV